MDAASFISWECPYKKCRPRRKRCKTLDELCEHILSIKTNPYICGHTRMHIHIHETNSSAYIEELTCKYCNKNIIPIDWSKRQKRLRSPDMNIPELKNIIRRKIIYHTSICDGFKNWFDIAQIKEGISRIEETQSKILELLEVALYGPGKGVKYQEALEDFESQKQI